MAYETPSVLLRDLGNEAFFEKYGSDRFAANLLGGRYRYIVRQMCANLLYNAFSPILRDSFDFGAVLCGPPELNYDMCAVSNSLQQFTGPMGDAVRNCIIEYGPENIEPGDVLMVNDPYRAGNHVNDLCIIRPVFYDGRIVAFLSMRAHQIDMGGITAGGFDANKSNVYETGLVIPPTLLYRRDKPVRSSYNLILDNARFGAMLLPDLKSLYQGLVMGEKLFTAILDRYGVDASLGAMRYVCDASAETLAEGIRTGIPDGVYNGEVFLDADGVDDKQEYRIKLALTKVGSNIEIDFSGTSRQARTCINCSPIDTKSAVAIALKYLVDRSSPLTTGSYRPVDIVIPPGTLLSATPPDGAIFMYWQASNPVVRAIHLALSEALGERAIGGDAGTPILHNASGVKDGEFWVSVAPAGASFGAWGATSKSDADSCQVNRCVNIFDNPVEMSERDAPLIQLRREYVTDSAGAGVNRGGAAILTDNMWTAESSHIPMPLEVKAPAGFGVNGGKAGTSVGCWLFRPDHFDVRGKQGILPMGGDVYHRSQPVGGVVNEETNELDANGTYRYFGIHSSWETPADSVFRYVTGGGGGWGDPLERDPERVKRDCRDEYISIEGARRDYGVVILGDPHSKPEALEIDLAATQALRAQMRADNDAMNSAVAAE